MLRKHRRKIERKVRGEKSKPKRRKKHLDLAITNRFTRATTYCLIVFDFVFVIWWLQSLLLYWQEILAKLSNMFNVIGGWIR